MKKYAKQGRLSQISVLGMVLLLVACQEQQECPAAPNGVQEQGSAGPRYEAPPLDSKERARLDRALSTMQEVRAEFVAKELGLEEKQVTQLEELLRARDLQRTKLKRAVREQKRRLAKAIDAQADAAELERLIQALDLAEDALAESQDELFEATSALLNANEQAKLRLALPLFEREVERSIRRAKRQGFGAGKGGQQGKAGRFKKGRGRGHGPGHQLGWKRWLQD